MNQAQGRGRQVVDDVTSRFTADTARRKAIYEELHPEAAYEARPGRAGKCRQVGDNSDTADRFTADTATKTGKSVGSSSSLQVLEPLPGRLPGFY